MKKKLSILLGILLLLAAGAYIVYTTILIPRMLKEKVRAMQPVFVSYTKSLDQITEHLQSDTTATDAAGLQRDGEKGKKLLQQAETSRKNIDLHIQTLTMPHLTSYKQTIIDSVKQGALLESMEKESSALSLAYVPILRRYETVSQTVNAANTTVTNDPAKYQKNITLALTQEEAILADLKNIQSTNEFQTIHQAFIGVLEAEVTLLKQLQEAIKKKDEKAVATIVKNYTNEREKRAQALSIATTKMRAKVKMLADNQKKHVMKQQTVYQELKKTYKL